MKKKLQFIFISAIICMACNNQPDSTKPAVKKDVVVQDSFFYKRFEGTIAGQPVVMHLHKSKIKTEATYYYKNTGGWITLIADNITGDSIIFSEYAPVYNMNNDTDEDTLRPQLLCRLHEDMLTGNWFSKDKKTSYPIELKEICPDGSYQFSIETFSDSMKAYPAKKESPAAEIDNSFVVAKNNEWINAQVKEIIGYDSSLDFATGYSKKKKEYFDDYKKDVPAELDSNEIFSLNYSLSNDLHVRYNEKGFVILESEEYSFSGGAHGNYGSYFHCLDVTSKKKLHLQDIITTDSATLQKIVEAAFRKQYNVPGPLKEVLFENFLAANDNFFFNEKGLGFLYNPYEVASYAQGQITVIVSFTSLSNYLVPSFKSRMGIK